MLNPRSGGHDLRFEIVEIKRTYCNIISRGLTFLEESGISMECYGVQTNLRDSRRTFTESKQNQQNGNRRQFIKFWNIMLYYIPSIDQSSTEHSLHLPYNLEQQ